MSKEISPKPSHEWMIAYTTYNVHEAQIVAGRLESEGIPAMVHQQAGANAMGIHIGRLGEVYVLVHPDHYEWALSILFPDVPDELPGDVDQIIFGSEDDNSDDDEE